MTEIEVILQKIVRDNHSPSVQYMLFDKDSILEKYSYGCSDISGNKMAGGYTTYNAFSITKTFTALAILQLAEQKKIDIEEPVKKYLPDFPYSGGITIRQLLAHSAGIPNPVPLSWIHLTTEHTSFDSNNFFKPVFSKNNTVKSPTNQTFAYSNLGYILLGQLIEAVTKTSYEHYIRENIINRLELKNNELGFEITAPDIHAKGYHKKWSITNLLLGFFIDKSKYMGNAEGKWKPFRNFYVNGTSYGGLIGTPGAFVKYLQELLQPNSRLLSDEYKRKMFTENHTANSKATGMCLSWFSGQLNGIRYFTHAGGGGGYYAELRLYPDKGMGSVVFFNRTGMADERFLDKVDTFYFNSIK